MASLSYIYKGKIFFSKFIEYTNVRCLYFFKKRTDKAICSVRFVTKKNLYIEVHRGILYELTQRQLCKTTPRLINAYYLSMFSNTTDLIRSRLKFSTPVQVGSIWKSGSSSWHVGVGSSWGFLKSNVHKHVYASFTLTRVFSNSPDFFFYPGQVLGIGATKVLHSTEMLRFHL